MASASLIMDATVPTIAKAFSPASIYPNGTSILTFTVNNSNAAPMTSVAFSDTFPTNMVVANPTGAASSCGGR